MDSENSLSKRLKRYASVATKMAGVAAKTAGTKLVGKENDGVFLQEALGALKGPAMKVGQILGMVPNLFPDNITESLRHLQSQAPAMGWPFVRRRMATELGKDWQANFSSFDQKASFAASLGQVHKAVTIDNHVVACKLQYPDMESTIEADLNQLTFILGVYESYSKSLDTSKMREEIAERLREELDYQNEAKNIGNFEEIARKIKFLNIPEVVPSLTTKRLLTMSWLDGKCLLDFKESSVDVRKTIARRLFYAWYMPLYKHGMLHADPHYGNYSFTEDLSLNLLDFGCVRYFDQSFLLASLDLYKAVETNNDTLAMEAYQSWGFENISKELTEALNLWAKYLFDPLIENKERPLLYDTTIGGRVLKGVLEALKKEGGVTPPKEFVFMDRAAVGIGSAMIHLNVEMNWHHLFHEILEESNLIRKN